MGEFAKPDDVTNGCNWSLRYHKAQNRLARFLGLNRNIMALLTAIVVIGAGEEMWMRFVPKYLEALGASVLVIGLFDALKTLLGAIYAYPGGVLADRWGHRRSLVAFNVLSIAGYTIVLAIPHWSAVIAGMFLFLAWSCFSLPATFSLIGTALTADKHAMGIGMQSLVKRIPVLFGPILGGLLIDRFGLIPGVRIALGISIALGIITIFFQQRILEEIKAPAREVYGFFGTLRSFPSPLRRLLLSDILIRFCERLPYAWVVIYAMNTGGVSGLQVGYLTGIEILVAMACFIPVSHLADKYGREPFVIATFIFFTLFPVTLLRATSFPLLALAFAVRGLKEFGEPARKALIIGHCPAERRGQMVGAYYLVRDLVVTPGALLGALLWEVGPHVNFWGAAVLGATGTIYYMLTARSTPATTSAGSQ